MNNSISLVTGLLTVALLGLGGSCQKPSNPSLSQQAIVLEETVVDSIWTGHPVDFALLTHPPHQFVAYYNQNQRLVVAHRQLNQARWTYQFLPETIGWDSHNYIRMGLDNLGHVHLSGNMHVSALNYYRTTKPYDISTFEAIHKMVGKQEDRVTYPEFFYSPTGQLMFAYRDGSSGKGNQIYNTYDADRKTWQRALSTQLVDGGEMNAYLHGPTLGPDGFYHFVWVWRDTPDASTNHDLSYVKSPDFKTWYRSDGTIQSLPITYENAEIVDPVPSGGGIINGNTVIGFDLQQRPVITYHKYDSVGNTQVFNARLEERDWQRYQATHWDFRWSFGGHGSIRAEVKVSPVRAHQGKLTQEFYSDRQGRSRYVLDNASLSQQEEVAVLSIFPPSLDTLQSSFPGLQVNYLVEGNPVRDNYWYVLRWETLGRNRDRPRSEPLPGPLPLRMFRVGQPSP